MRLGAGLSVMSALLLAPGCVGAVRNVDSGEQISIAYRWPTILCTGLCPTFRVNVDGAGHVGLVNYALDEGNVTSRTRFRVTRATLRAFRQALAPLRPVHDTRTHETCPVPWTTPPGDDEHELWRQVDEVEVRWSQTWEMRVLHACWSDRSIKAVTDLALEQLRVSTAGNRASARALRDARMRREAWVNGNQ